MTKRRDVPEAVRAFSAEQGRLGVQPRWGNSTEISRKRQMAWPSFMLQHKKHGYEKAVGWLSAKYGEAEAKNLLRDWTTQPKKRDAIRLAGMTTG